MTSGRRGSLLCLGAGALLGVGVWVFSPWLTGRTEPWDAELPFWPLSWLVVAVVGGARGRLHGVCLPGGYALGQILATAPATFASEFGPLGWMFVAGYGVVASCFSLAIAATVMLVRAHWRRSGSG